MLNNFGKFGIKENLAKKLKQIGQTKVTPDWEEVLHTKICRKFFRKVTVLANGVKNSMTASIIDFCSVFNLQSLSFSALVKGTSNPLLNNEAINFCNFLFALRACAVRSKYPDFG